MYVYNLRTRQFTQVPIENVEQSTRLTMLCHSTVHLGHACVDNPWTQTFAFKPSDLLESAQVSRLITWAFTGSLAIKT